MLVAVTGGTGCLGRPLVRNLLERGCEVSLLRRSPVCLDPMPAGRIRLVDGTINDKRPLEDLLDGCEVVFHLAGKVHDYSRSAVSAAEHFKVNLEGTRLLLKVAGEKKVKRLVFYSTVAVYGADADFHGDEESPCHPETPYGLSKYEAERCVLDAHRNSGPEGVVLRLPVVYGPLDRGNVARLINSIYMRQFVFFGSGDSLRSMISSENAASAALSAAFSPGATNRVFCVSDGVDYTLKDLVWAICDCLRRPGKPPHLPLPIGKCVGKIGDILEGILSRPLPINSDRVRKLSTPLTLSCVKAQEQLGYRPAYSFRNAIKDEVEWLRLLKGW